MQQRMKRIAAVLLAITAVFSACCAAAAESSSKISPSLAAEVEAQSCDEKLTVAVWTVTGGDFINPLDLIEYVNQQTYLQCGLTPGTCQTMEEVDTYTKIYNRILYDLETASIPAVIKKLALTDEDILDRGGNMLVVSLTKEQIAAAAALDEVILVEGWNEVPPVADPLSPEPYEPLDPPVTEPDPLLRGDADGDGGWTILDATLIQRWLVKLEGGGTLAINGDADSDGQVTVLDATRIQRFLANICSMDGELILP